MSAEYLAWINGDYVPLSEAKLSIFDAGITSGASVSERLRTFRHEPFLLDAHVDRLVASARSAFIPLRLPADALGRLIREVAGRNAELVPAESDLAVSAFVTAGSSGRPTLCVSATEIPAPLYVADYEGIALATPETRALPAETVSPHVKSRSRLHWHIADAQAGQTAEALALLLDSDGRLTETATGNLFVYDGTTLLTPRRERTLCGISQQYVMELAGRLGISCREEDLWPADLAAARESFVTSSVYCILPVTRFNRANVGDGRPGLIQRRLLDAWSNAVGVDIVEQMKQIARQ